MRNEIRDCDICGKRISQDTSVFIGGTLELDRGYVTDNAYYVKWVKDLCWDCAEIIDKYIEQLTEKAREK